ncbi:hypothetical protein Q8A67_000344 [Cirrhinus molitorella]|uniref:Uncharacterized protein n=1 Tax=Cirrhinus molitorella TaxID=172907 RepID=A0AA88U040_9TELE|nr:hypothetical protein Q8A67_000344 [Cirrhinus molitorella]
MRQMCPFNIWFVFASCLPKGPFEESRELGVWAHYSDARCAGVTIRQRRRRSEVPAVRLGTPETPAVKR